MEAILVCCNTSLSQPELWGVYGFICALKWAPQGRYRLKNQSNKSRLERNKESPVLWLICILPLQVELWNQFSGLSAASWAARNFAQASADFLPPLKHGFLLSVPPCSCSLLICGVSAPWSLLLTLVCSLFPAAFLLEVPEHFSLQGRLGDCPGKKWSTEASTVLALLLKWTFTHTLETSHTYEQSPPVMAVAENRQMCF